MSEAVTQFECAVPNADTCALAHQRVVFGDVLLRCYDSCLGKPFLDGALVVIDDENGDRQLINTADVDLERANELPQELKDALASTVAPQANFEERLVERIRGEIDG